MKSMTSIKSIKNTMGVVTVFTVVTDFNGLLTTEGSVYA